MFTERLSSYRKLPAPGIVCTDPASARNYVWLGDNPSDTGAGRGRPKNQRQPGRDLLHRNRLRQHPVLSVQKTLGLGMSICIDEADRIKR